MRDNTRFMPRRLALNIFIGLAICVALIGNSPNASAVVPSVSLSKVERAILTDTEGGETTSFVILLSQQADLSAAHDIVDSDARGWYVYNTLKAHAERTQTELRALLDAEGAEYKPYWAANMIVTSGDRALIERIASRSDVRLLESNRPFRAIDPIVEPPSLGPESTAAVEWGVQNVNAPQLWQQGFTGIGVVVAGQDTGIRWTHAALKPKYRGWNGTVADHNYNWWDAIHSNASSNPCGADSKQPCDDNGHGTHTVGSMLGDDGAGNQVGVAPGARWIGCRNMNNGVGTPATYSECFQFFLAPTDLNGQNADPTKRPHIMNNSWGCPPEEGCAANSLRQVVENSVASGIFVVASAGNSGSGCSTVTDPPPIYGAAFSVGAYSSTNTLAPFSSRGPVTVDGSNRRKPDIAAPGVGVRSATQTSDGSYTVLSGTSMAGPHVAGSVALLWSARPHLTRNIAATRAILEQSANPGVDVIFGPTECGGTTPSQIPNNHFGYGRVDALAAYNASPPETCTVQFSDLPSANTFYSSVRCLACAGVVSGYADNTFRPNAPITRGQIAKIVSNSAGLSGPAGAQIYADVPPDHTFYEWINRLSKQGVITGYPCGGVVEPCVNNMPYFRPGNSATRGQIAKIVSQAAGYNDMPTGQTFEDVGPANTFYIWIERLASRQAVGGYACGQLSGEPCVTSKPYFRPGNDVTRGQAAKIVAGTFYPSCNVTR